MSSLSDLKRSVPFSHSQRQSVKQNLIQPTGIVLMFWPFGSYVLSHTHVLFTDEMLAWSLTMSAFRTGINPMTYSVQLFKCYLAAFIVRCSACTVNDIVDRNMDMGVGKFRWTTDIPWTDRQIERTRNRPLPSGRVSILSALIFLFVQYIVGLVFFYLAFSDLA